MARKQILTFDKVLDAKIALMKYSELSSNTNNINKMKKFVSVALDKSVTELQRYCITEHYLNHRLVKDIATELSVNSSTVTRHIQRGIKNMQKASEYISFYN